MEKTVEHIEIHLHMALVQMFEANPVVPPDKRTIKGRPFIVCLSGLRVGFVFVDLLHISHVTRAAHARNRLAQPNSFPPSFHPDTESFASAARFARVLSTVFNPAP